MNKQSPPRRLRGMRRRSRRSTFWSFAPALVVTTSFLSASVSPASNLPGHNEKVLFADNAVVYSNDFGSSIGSEWSANAGILTTPSSERVLGSTTQFGSPDLVVNETLALTLTGLQTHSLVDLSVDLYTVKSWDGNRTDFGPDSWDLNVTGTSPDVQPLTTFSNFVGVNQAYPDAYPGGSNPGTTGAAATGDLLGLGSSGNGEIPAARYGFSYSFAHAANSVTFNFTGSNLQHAFDEGWVLDNVVVSVTDLPPVASFTANPNPAACGQAITFDASGSTHQNPDRSIVSYAWDFGDTATASGQVVTHAYSAFGTYTATLTVTDDSTPPRTDTATVTISVSQGNTPPVASPGGPYSVPLGEEITLNGTGSSDPNASCGDSIVAYEWDISNDGDIDHAGSTPTLTAQEVETLGAGAHPVTLTVRDEFGAQSVASTTITVFVDEPVAIASASPTDAGCAEAITFNGSGSYHPNPNRSIVAYAWDFGDGTTGSGVTVTHTYFGNGTFTATLTVTDDNTPPRTNTDTVTVIVSWPNHDPAVSPGGPYTVPLREGITLDGSASSDTDEACGDSIVAYEWDISNDGDIDHTGSTPTLTAQEVENLGAGTHQVRLAVRDEFGATGTASTTLTVFVDEPVASFTASPNPAGCAEAITFDASSSTHPNPNRSIVSYAWDFGDGATGSGVIVTHTYLGNGTFTATLTVTDDNAPPRTDTATVTITVTWPNQAPVARPGGPYNVPVGGGITLDGSASSDPNQACGDQIAAYEWDVSNDGDIDHTGPTPTLTAQEVEALGTGTHQVALRVRDEFGTTNIATTTLTVFDSPATISGDLSCNSVNGNGFASSSSVSVVVKDAPGGATVYSNPSVPTDGNGNFNLFCGFGPDLAPGMEITVSDGSSTKVLLLADLSIDQVNPGTDTVSGTAPPGAQVNVGVNNPPSGGGANLTVIADTSGAWTADFTGTFDITGGTNANASVRDEDGDSTFVNKSTPTISGDLSCNSVNGNGFAPSSSVSVVVKDAPGGATVYSNPSVPTDGIGNFNLFCGFGPDLVPGMEITVSDGPTTRVLVLADLSIDAVNLGADTVSGTAPSGAEVQVGVNNPPGPGGADLTVIADTSGAWTADFTGTLDITGGTHATASVRDGDGDSTFVNKSPPTIDGDITDDGIGGGGFAENSTVTVEVRSTPGGSLLFGDNTPTDGDGNFGLCCGTDAGLPDLVPGMEITVSDGPATKVLVLADLTIDAVDPSTDVVSGTAPANSSLFVGVNNPPGPGGAGLNTTSDGTGSWSVDFTGTFDIDALTHTDVHVLDEDGDATSAQERPPTIHGNYCCFGGNINGDSFTVNSSVTVEIFDSPGGTLLVSDSVPTDRFGNFGFDLESTGVSLAPGMHVVAADGTTSDVKELTLVALTFDALNFTNDTASGTASPGTTVLVGVFDGPSLEVVTNGSGDWFADFGAQGFDVTFAMGAIAQILDSDGDSTDDEVFPPTISANLIQDHVGGSDFTPNSSVTVEIFDSPGGTLLFSGSAATGDFGEFGVSQDATGVNLVPGMQVTATDDTTSGIKELTLVPITFDVLNLITDTASGTAAPNATVFLEIFDSGGEFSRQLTADGSGAWSVDLGAAGFDVINGGGNASIRDADDDSTEADRGVPAFSAILNTDDIGGYNFTNSSTVSLRILDSAGGTLLFSGSVPVGADSTFTVGFNTHGVDLVAGMHITVTDDATSVAKELTLVSVTFDVLDPVNDVASGTAPPGMLLALQVGEGGGETAPADQNGDWFAGDFGPPPGLTADVSASICAVDGDGDCTGADYVPSSDLSLTKTDPPGRQPTGRNMTYTLTVVNDGPKAAYEVVATDQLPSSVTFVSATATQGNCTQSGGTVTCTLGTIGSGATVPISIVVKPTVAGTITNTASVSASTPDPQGSNNADSENTSICRITSRRSSIPCG
jgi:uncharacterized repeat protein (TIGR01451 family)